MIVRSNSNNDNNNNNDNNSNSSRTRVRARHLPAVGEHDLLVRPVLQYIYIYIYMYNTSMFYILHVRPVLPGRLIVIRIDIVINSINSHKDLIVINSI